MPFVGFQIGLSVKRSTPNYNYRYLIMSESTGGLTPEPKVDDEMVRKLSEGIVNIYHPTLKLLKSHLLEIVKKQEFLHDEMHSENLKLSEAIYSRELQEMFIKIKLYKEKLVSIKKTMITLHEQSKKLKKRALKLEQQKQKEALDRVHKREFEELLIRKPPAS